jgi:glycosyltransferase involved in cell wall biosynthesis
MNVHKIRIAPTLLGNIYHDPFAIVKYSYLFKALGSQSELYPVKDVSLKKFQKYFVAGITLHPKISVWKERFYKNLLAFYFQSLNAKKWLSKKHQHIDYSFQHGAMYNNFSPNNPIPNILYLDYTSTLSKKSDFAGRSPFSGKKYFDWLKKETEVYQQSEYIFVRSKMVKTSLMIDYGIDAEKIFVVGGGANFTNIPSLKNDKRTNNKIKFLFIGKDFYRKGGDIVLESFKEIHQKYPFSELTMITNIPKAYQSGITPNVNIIEPSWNRDEILKEYAKADIFINMSRLETWGDVVIEAMAYGLPCIVSNADAMSEIVENNKTGFVILCDRDILVNKMEELILNSNKRQTMGKLSHERVINYFTWDVVAKKMIGYLNLKN